MKAPPNDEVQPDATLSGYMPSDRSMSNQIIKTQADWRNRFEILLLGAIAVLSAVVAIFDFLGVLDGIPWLASRIPTLILLVVGLSAGYLVLERRNQLERMQRDYRQNTEKLTQAISQSTRTIIESLGGFEFKQFESGTELMKYINKRLLQARRQVDDLSWSYVVGLGRDLNIVQEINTEYTKRIARVSEKIPYREIFIFNRKDRIEKLKKRLEENLPGYSCAYYENTAVPLLQFMIIDGEEVIVLSDMLESKFAIRHPHLVKLFVEYYEEIWKRATQIKMGTTVNQDVIESILHGKVT